MKSDNDVTTNNAVTIAVYEGIRNTMYTSTTPKGRYYIRNDLKER